MSTLVVQRKANMSGAIHELKRLNVKTTEMVKGDTRKVLKSELLYDVHELNVAIRALLFALSRGGIK